MDDVILRVLMGEASLFEEERLRRWRSEAPANEVYFQEMSRIWEISGPGFDSRAALEVGDEEVDALCHSVLEAAEERRGAPPVRNGSGNRKPMSRRIRTLVLWGTSLAAGLGALALGVHRIQPTWSDDSSSTPGVAAASTTPQTLRLEDGSYVRLAPGSRLDVRFAEDRRLVSLQGRAFFAVAPDSSRPFLVRTGGAEVQVLGTRFEVAEGDDGIRAVVVEGRVSLSSPWGEVQVPAGSVGRAPPGGAPRAEEVADPWSLLDWQGGLLVFHGTPLETVAREVEAHFGLPVRLGDLTAGSRRISASFQGGESFHEVLETLCVVSSTVCDIAADSAVIGPVPGGGS